MRPESQEGRALDARLREGLAADPVGLVHRAMGAGVQAARRPVRRLALAATVMAGLVVATLLALPLLRGPAPHAPLEARLSMVNVGEVIVVRDVRGRTSVLRSGGAAAADLAPRGQIMIHRRER